MYAPLEEQIILKMEALLEMMCAPSKTEEPFVR
jgi:hypothetical protein